MSTNIISVSDRQRMELLDPPDIARIIPDDKLSAVIAEMYPDKDRMRGEYGVIASGMVHDSNGDVRTFVGFKDALTERVVFVTLHLDPSNETHMNLKVGDEVLVSGELDRRIAEITATEVEVTRNIFDD